ncbi:MAG: ABC transporter substrate-binding protein [Acetobacteraceae bacterium]|nr:ABC transporter substrate-binding protein [Acetobacteraceae bacterium]
MRSSFPAALAAGTIGLLLSAGGVRAQQVTVGVIESQSGPVSSIGIPLMRGLAAAMVNGGVIDGVHFKTIALDDASDPATSARDARKLVDEDKVDVLFGSSGTPATLAVNSVAAEAHVPLVITANTLVQGAKGDWEITIPQPFPLMVAADVQEMKKQGIKTVAYIGYNDAFGDLVYDALKQTAEPAGIKIVADERYARTDTSATPQALKIIALHPDAVLTGGSGSPGALPHIALKQLGYKGAEYSTHAIINAEFVRIGGDAVNGVIAPSGPVVVAEQLPDSNPIKAVAMQFRHDYEKANGSASSDAFPAYAYDAMLVLADAAKRTLATGAKPGTPEFRTALRDALYSTRDLVGAHAVYNFKPGDRYGTDERSRVLVELEKGTWTLLN